MTRDEIEWKRIDDKILIVSGNQELLEVVKKMVEGLTDLDVGYQPAIRTIKVTEITEEEKQELQDKLYKGDYSLFPLYTDEDKEELTEEYRAWLPTFGEPCSECKDTLCPDCGYCHTSNCNNVHICMSNWCETHQTALEHTYDDCGSYNDKGKWVRL